ncbi:DUF6069 family protein [Streptomyces chartreusis]
MSTRTRRVGVTALTVVCLAPVLVCLAADPLLGHRLRIAGSKKALDIGAVRVAIVALLASLCGWGLLTALERPGPRRGQRHPDLPRLALMHLAVSHRRHLPSSPTLVIRV